MASASVQQRSLSLAVTAATPRRLFPAWLAQEWFFWLIFASWTILPSTSTPWWEIAGIQIKSVDALTILFCLLYAVPRIASPSRRLPRGWHLWLPLSLIALAAWGMVSTSWSGAGPRNNLAMGYCMALTAASGILAYLVISSVSDVRGFLWRLVVALSCVCGLYTAQSVLGLGLRDASAITLNDFGMERVRGPLFEASTGYFLLIPAMAFALQRNARPAGEADIRFPLCFLSRADNDRFGVAGRNVAVRRVRSLLRLGCEGPHQDYRAGHCAGCRRRRGNGDLYQSKG